jgi:hypothetical protein
LSPDVAEAFQDCYPERFSHCFGCGRSNPHGHHLKSYWDGEETVSRFTVSAEYSGGVPGHEMGDGGHFMRFVTATLKGDYLRPTPIGVELVIRGRLRGIEGRKVQVSLSLVAEGSPCATAEMLAIRFRD